MYLEEQVFVAPDCSQPAENWDETYYNIAERTGVKSLEGKKVKTLIAEVGYWRKANHIHKWFVDNVQEGVDECRRSYVSVNQLEDLLNTCKDLITCYKEDPETANKVAEIQLPSTEGFFFGGTDYDEWYWRDVEMTIDILQPIVDAKKEEPISGEYTSYFYRSSW